MTYLSTFGTIPIHRKVDTSGTQHDCERQRPAPPLLNYVGARIIGYL